jgi:molecular chaperone HtpG
LNLLSHAPVLTPRGRLPDSGRFEAIAERGETLMTTGQTYAFQAEVSQLLDLVIHSLYGHKEVFLRELVSNASDALDKLRFRALTEPGLAPEGASLEIRIVPDAEAGTLTIEDVGVGMSRDEMIQNLGTIAHSGTKEFLEAMRKAGKSDANLIGQFGVGFYSAYLVADRVTVISRAAGATEAHRWESDAKSSFTIEALPEGSRPAPGTAVILHLKDDQKDLLDGWRLRELVRRYSDFVSYPILIETEKKADGAEGEEAGYEKVFETANRASALWQRPRGEITDEQHADFFKHLTHEGEEPLARTHFTIEGSQVFTALLYVPKHPPMFESHDERRGVRLFVKRVFIMDDCRELLPPWLRFVRGVVDSDDLPLNVSRETLQDSAVVRTIKRQVTKKVLDLLEEIAKEKPADYAQFWRSWGVSLKEAVATDWESKDRAAKLLRYASSKAPATADEKAPTSEGTSDEPKTEPKTEAEALTSLDEYVARMPEGQPAIYYVLGESARTLAGSPHIEALTKRGYEVLFLTDPVDELVTDALRTFGDKPLVSAMRADLSLKDEAADKAREEQSKTLEPFLARVKEVLASQVSDVRVSSRLTDSPCCLVVGAGQHHAYLEQAMRRFGREIPAAKRTLEINAEHPLVVALKGVFEREGASPRLTEWIELLHDQALLTEGSKIADPNRFARRMTDLLQQAAKGALG